MNTISHNSETKMTLLNEQITEASIQIWANLQNGGTWGGDDKQLNLALGSTFKAQYTADEMPDDIGGIEDTFVYDRDWEMNEIYEIRNVETLTRLLIDNPNQTKGFSTVEALVLGA